MIALNNLRAMFSVLAFCVKAFLIISVVALVMNLIHYYRSDDKPANKGPAIVVPSITNPSGK
jgi:hypothetical protein